MVIVGRRGDVLVLGGRCDRAAGGGDLDGHCARCVGAVVLTTIFVAASDVTVAALPPKVTAVAPARWVPLMVTTVPPVVVPVAGVNVVIVGAGVTYLYLAADVTEPPGVVTLMVTVPAVSARWSTTSFVAASDVTWWPPCPRR